MLHLSKFWVFPLKAWVNQSLAACCKLKRMFKNFYLLSHLHFSKVLQSPYVYVCKCTKLSGALGYFQVPEIRHSAQRPHDSGDPPSEGGRRNVDHQLDIRWRQSHSGGRQRNATPGRRGRRKRTQEKIHSSGQKPLQVRKFRIYMVSSFILLISLSCSISCLSLIPGVALVNCAISHIFTII